MISEGYCWKSKTNCGYILPHYPSLIGQRCYRSIPGFLHKLTLRCRAQRADGEETGYNDNGFSTTLRRRIRIWMGEDVCRTKSFDYSFKDVFRLVLPTYLAC